MNLKRRLPDDRTFEQIKNHYQVEKSIALKLKSASREERRALYPHIYDELFKKVPDHPRLRRIEDSEEITALNRKKLEMAKKYLNESVIFVEFAPGDCHFASYVTQFVKYVYAIDISDQRSPAFKTPDNFRLVLYDGYDLDLKENSADVVFSDQLIEHLHPEDVEFHFELIKRILRDKGVYIFRTPHAFFGPHDISKYFSEEPEGFHLKEWTYSEIGQILKRVNYSFWYGFLRVKKKYTRIPFGYFKLVEIMLQNLPIKQRRFFSRFFLSRQMLVIGGKFS